MKVFTKWLNRVFIDGLSGMAHGLFATLIVGTIIQQIGTLVDAGARVLDVVVEHDVYGQIAADLMIASRRDVDEFITKIFANEAKPLKELTHDAHFHTLEAENEAILDEAEKRLKEKGYLLDFAGNL